MKKNLKRLAELPNVERLETSLRLLLKKAVTGQPQLRLLSKDECEEIGLVDEATDVIVKVHENRLTYSSFYALLNAPQSVCPKRAHVTLSSVIAVGNKATLIHPFKGRRKYGAICRRRTR